MADYIRWRDSLCDGCGVEARLGLDPFTTFAVTDEVCYGCQLKESKQREIANAAGENHAATAGVKVWVSDAREWKGARWPVTT